MPSHQKSRLWALFLRGGDIIPTLCNIIGQNRVNMYNFLNASTLQGFVYCFFFVLNKQYVNISLVAKAGLNKIKIVQNPREFPDELSKFTRLLITQSAPLRMYLVSWIIIIIICLIDFYCLDIKTSLSDRFLSYTQFRCLFLIYDYC